MKPHTIGLAAFLTSCPKSEKTIEQPVILPTPAANQISIAQYLLQTGGQHANDFYGRAYDLPVGDVTWCYKEQGVPNNYADDVLILGIGTHATYVDEGLDGVVDYLKDPHTADRILLSSLPEQEQLARRAEYDLFIADYANHIKSEGF